MPSSFRLKLDLQWFAGEKTEQATPKKKQDARKKGQVAKSMELPAAFVLLFTFAALYLFRGFFRERLYRLFTVTFNDYMNMDVTIPNVTQFYDRLALQGVELLLPILGIVLVTGLLANYLQIGLLFTGQPLVPKFSKINPLQGAKRLFALRGIIEFLKSCLKMLIVGLVVFFTLWNQRGHLAELSTYSLDDIMAFALQVTINIGLEIGLILVIMAVFDFLYQRYEHNKSLKMSKQEVKDEHKNTEGDPLIKGKIRERQRRMAMQRMMQSVPQADVIITNPTHFAVALKYDAESMQAPTVIAKGMDYVALKIKQIAIEHGIVTMENKPLARALYEQVELGEAIPADLFQAVAEVLAYVYKLRDKAKQGRVK